ncbi:reverse transcriptase domain-containing protein, partial [Tanacetum coccineum]
MEEDYKPAVQHQRRVNPKIHDVIKKEVEKLLDAGLIYPISDKLKVCEAKTNKSSIDEPPEVELKDLPHHLEYAFLEGDNKLPVIIAKDLSVKEKAALINILKRPHLRVLTERSPTVACLLAYAMHRARSKDKMLQRCEDTNLYLNWEKSHFMVKEGIVLGHKISKKGLRLDLPFELMYDASDYAIGAVVGQHHEKHFRPIYYASKTMNEAESHYTMTEKEMLAVVYAFEKFQSYLILNKCIVYTDHSALKYLFAKKDSKARLLETDIRQKDEKSSKNRQNRARNGKAWKRQIQIEAK